MKKKLYFLPILVLLLSLFLFGCMNNDNNDGGNNNDKPTTTEGEGTAYGLVNKAYVGKATVKIKNDKVVDVIYDEAFLPHTWANIDYKMEEGSQLADDVLMYTKEDMNSFYAKYISIDGQVFTGVVRENDLVLDSTTYTAQVVNYSNEKIPDLFAYLYNSDANCEWYFNAVKNGKVFICDKDGKKLETYPSLNTYGWLKSEGKYWNASEDSPLGWKGNIDNMVSYLKDKVLTNLDESKFVKDTEGTEENGYKYQYWTIDGVKTKVTMTDAYQYYKLAYSAYNKAKANVK